MPPPEVENMTAEEFYASNFVKDGRAKPERKSENQPSNFLRLFAQPIKKKILLQEIVDKNIDRYMNGHGCRDPTT